MRREVSSTVTTVLLSLLIFLFMSGQTQARLLEEVCPSSCGDINNISYPFRLKTDPPNCGDYGYELSCENNKTIMEFHSGKYYVKQISYDKHIIRLVDVNIANGSCSLPYKSLTRDEIRNDDRYQGIGSIFNEFATFVNCSSNISYPVYRKVDCLSRNDSHVYVIYGGKSVSDLRPSCFYVSMVAVPFKDVKNASYETIMRLMESGFYLEWSVGCSGCFADGGVCASSFFEDRFIYVCDKSDFIAKLLPLIFSLLGYFLLVVILIARYIITPLVLVVFFINKYRTTRKSADNVEKFLLNQQSLMPKRYSHTDLIAMTNHFRDKLGQGGFGTVYEGQLPGGCLIAVKMLGNSKFSGEEFINEVSTIGRIHHVNVVQLVGFCSEGSHRALVYEYMPNGSLDKHIFSKEGRVQSFSWEKLHDIALGAAKGIEYLHGGCDVCILHFDIKPHNVLLDHNFTPKIADFGLAKFYPKEYDFVSISTTRGTIGYIAPELISRNFGSVSSKSDVYSFGMLLLEMAGGRRNADIRADHSSKVYFPSWVYERLDEGGDLELENVTEIEVTIARKLCIIGLWCIQMKASDRPTMTKVVEMLEGNIQDLQMPPKPFLSSPQRMSTRKPQSDSSTEILISESVEESSYNDINV